MNHLWAVSLIQWAGVIAGLALQCQIKFYREPHCDPLVYLTATGPLQSVCPVYADFIRDTECAQELHAG
jgi:hypothetical protein